MKKGLTIFTAILLAGTIMTGCGKGSMESDAKKLGELTCKSKDLAAKALSGDLSIAAESAKVVGELEKLGNELKEKYKSEEDTKKFGEIYMKEIEKCK